MGREQPIQSVPRLLCLIGSAEVSPAMVSLHAELMDRVAVPPYPGVLLDTTYGFQENADDLSRKTRRYFARNVGHPIAIASMRAAVSTESVAAERAYQQLRDARYVFAGPGSPSYAVRHWRRTLIPQLLAERMVQGGCVTFASAAAMTIGRLAVPVYEIYKVGEAPHWIEGLDLLRPFGLDLVIITHYDNREGGSHDTRFCYLGERRLRQLERQLPDGTVIFGVAEHTAAIFDFDAERVEVRGRGSVVIRVHGDEHQFRSGSRFSFNELRPRGATRLAERPAIPHGGPVADAIAQRLRDFSEALQRAQFEQAVARLLDLDPELSGEGEPGARLSRSIFRGMLLQLGEAAQRAAIARQSLERIAEIALRLRDQARREHRYAEADRLREALRHLGIEVKDTPDGVQWSMIASMDD